MNKGWREAVLENVPHGEEGRINLNPKDAFTVSKILLNRGYAVCLTHGDIGDDLCVHWLFAGSVDDLDYSDYENVVFTSIDYINDYPKALSEVEDDSDKDEYYETFEPM